MAEGEQEAEGGFAYRHVAHVALGSCKHGFFFSMGLTGFATGGMGKPRLMGRWPVSSSMIRERLLISSAEREKRKIKCTKGSFFSIRVQVSRHFFYGTLLKKCLDTGLLSIFDRKVSRHWVVRHI